MTEAGTWASSGSPCPPALVPSLPAKINFHTKISVVEQSGASGLGGWVTTPDVTMALNKTFASFSLLSLMGILIGLTTN